jgi:hypothetical protein
MSKKPNHRGKGKDEENGYPSHVEVDRTQRNVTTERGKKPLPNLRQLRAT